MIADSIEFVAVVRCQSAHYDAMFRTLSPADGDDAIDRMRLTALTADDLLLQTDGLFEAPESDASFGRNIRTQVEQLA